MSEKGVFRVTPGSERASESSAESKWPQRKGRLGKEPRSSE